MLFVAALAAVAEPAHGHMAQYMNANMNTSRACLCIDVGEEPRSQRTDKFMIGVSFAI